MWKHLDLTPRKVSTWKFGSKDAQQSHNPLAFPNISNMVLINTHTHFSSRESISCFLFPFLLLKYRQSFQPEEDTTKPSGVISSENQFRFWLQHSIAFGGKWQRRARTRLSNDALYYGKKGKGSVGPFEMLGWGQEDSQKLQVILHRMLKSQMYPKFCQIKSQVLVLPTPSSVSHLWWSSI